MERSERLGSASHSLPTPVVPRDAEMRVLGVERQGWAPTAFDVHRLRIEYPVLLSVVPVAYPFDPTK